MNKSLNRSQMSEPVPLRLQILDLLKHNGVMSLREISDALGCDDDRVYQSLKRLWKKDIVLRTKSPMFLRNKVHRGRAGLAINTRAINYYVFNNGEELSEDFVSFSEKMKDGRDLGIKSKAKRIMEFLEEHNDKAFYSSDIVRALNIKRSDIMSNMRRYERKGLVFIRGYQTHDRRSPFQKGYILTWIDQNKPRDQALKEAYERTRRILTTEASSNTVYERVRFVRDQLITCKELLSRIYLKNLVRCSGDQIQRVLRRSMQLYDDVKEVKVFGFSYYYHNSITDADLKANVEVKKNYIRKTKGRNNRLGHNWEAVCEWFIEKFTKGAHFWTQRHRDRMDPRRITLHLLKSVGRRRMNAEVDRVWEVTPGLFSPPVTYVLECKWSFVTKQSLDDFINVLRWSTDFGTDTENGREVKKGVIPVFGAGAFNPRGKVVVNGKTATLAQYAAKMNIQLLKPSDFNKKLREHGVEKMVTVQKICRVCKDEKEIRTVLDEIWKKPSKAEKLLTETLDRNQGVFNFEKSLAN